MARYSNDLISTSGSLICGDMLGMIFMLGTHEMAGNVLNGQGVGGGGLMGKRRVHDFGAGLTA